MNKFALCALALGAVVMSSCRNDEPAAPGGNQAGWAFKSDSFTHLYILNEGGWGQNNARIDSLGFHSGTYADDVYTNSNPNVVMGLGDVGNELKEYRGRLYAVINGSHKVEIMNAADCRRIGQVNISSPRSIAFAGSRAFVSSWVGGDNGTGSVTVFNVNDLSVSALLSVGKDPEGVAVSGNRLFVACSGGMHMPDYENEVWVFDVNTLALETKVKVATNLHRMAVDTDGNVWLNGRGDYASEGSGLYRVRPDLSVDTIGVPCAGFAIGKDKVYYYASDWSNETMSNVVSYGTVSTLNLKPAGSFITDGTEADILVPYGIAVDPSTGRVFISDARNYASSGALNIYNSKGTLEQSFSTGICPSSILPVALVE